MILFVVTSSALNGSSYLKTHHYPLATLGLRTSFTAQKTQTVTSSLQTLEEHQPRRYVKPTLTFHLPVHLSIFLCSALLRLTHSVLSVAHDPPQQNTTSPAVRANTLTRAPQGAPPSPLPMPWGDSPSPGQTPVVFMPIFSLAHGRDSFLA